MVVILYCEHDYVIFNLCKILTFFFKYLRFIVYAIYGFTSSLYEVSQVNEKNSQLL